MFGRKGLLRLFFNTSSLSRVKNIVTSHPTHDVLKTTLFGRYDAVKMVK